MNELIQLLCSVKFSILNTGEVLKATISVYCEKDQPFPSMEEVVICTPQTSTEEVSSNCITDTSLGMFPRCNKLLYS